MKISHIGVEISRNLYETFQGLHNIEMNYITCFMTGYVLKILAQLFKTNDVVS